MAADSQAAYQSKLFSGSGQKSENERYESIEIHGATRLHTVLEWNNLRTYLAAENEMFLARS